MREILFTNFDVCLGLNQLPYSDCSVVTPTGSLLALSPSESTYQLETIYFRSNLRRSQIPFRQLRCVDCSIWRGDGAGLERLLPIDQNRKDLSWIRRRHSRGKSRLRAIPRRRVKTPSPFDVSDYEHGKHCCASCERSEGARSAWAVHHSLEPLLHTNRCSNDNAALPRNENPHIRAERRRSESLRSEVLWNRLAQSDQEVDFVSTESKKSVVSYVFVASAWELIKENKFIYIN